MNPDSEKNQTVRCEAAEENEGAVLDMDLIHIIIQIPKETAGLEVTATMLGEDMKPYKAYMKLTASDIREAREDFLENVEDGDEYDVLYVATDLGKELAKQMEAGETIDWNHITEKSEETL